MYIPSSNFILMTFSLLVRTTTMTVCIMLHADEPWLSTSSNHFARSCSVSVENILAKIWKRKIFRIRWLLFSCKKRERNRGRGRKGENIVFYCCAMRVSDGLYLLLLLSLYDNVVLRTMTLSVCIPTKWFVNKIHFTRSHSHCLVWCAISCTTRRRHQVTIVWRKKKTAKIRKKKKKKR